MTQAFPWEALCLRARARARELGEPVVASAVLPADGEEPLARLEAADGGAGSGPGSLGEFRFAWERPKDRFALAAAGVALRFRAEGERRFHDLAERVGTALKQAVTLSADGDEGDDLGGGDSNGDGSAPEEAGHPAAPPLAPIALGGFSFFDRLDETQWPGFGAAQLVIPRWMALRAGGRGRTVLSTAVSPEADPAAAARELAALAGRMARGPGASPAPPEGALRRLDDVEGHRRWLAMVRQALAGIHAGRLSKVVLARTVELLGALPAPFRALRALRAAYPDCFTFWIDPGQGQAFLGASPERLARLARGTLHLGALAGSAPRGDRPDADEANGRRLMQSEKERGEHATVVEAILEAVRPLGGELECPEAPRLVKLTNVQHLYTPITLRPAGPLSLIALLGRLHPTPAVGGHPRPEALALIRAAEGFDRGWYAGPVGWIDARGEGEFAVALRSGALRRDAPGFGESAAGRVRLFTGAGIVADSDPEMEYFETQLKLQPMLNALVTEHPHS